ncbi:hypothetical protein LSH36_55g09061 [Paralvinella palmiformis]|uniref:Eukaryotic translation initiation factor 5B n=1 Tax=Paralvinella palmiformis TaxID=53620 RepID=A0AAD9NCM7_9ANNE|nr:hypothetical protein LSH36_55g09061 [Paralvinella palmiformis]
MGKPKRGKKQKGDDDWEEDAVKELTGLSLGPKEDNNEMVDDDGDILSTRMRKKDKQNNKQLQSTIINGQNTLVVQAVEEKKDINLQVEVLMWSAKLCKWIPIPVSRRRQYMQPWSVKKNHCQASLKQSQACPCLQMKKMPKFAEMQEDENTESDEDEPAVQVKGNKSAKSTFQMLSLDSDEQSKDSSDSDVDSAPKPDQEEDKEMAPVKSTDQGTSAKSKVKSKGKDKKQSRKDEEDIDALLAEIEGRSETKQDPFKGKKKKKSKPTAGKVEVENVPDKETERQISAEVTSTDDGTTDIGLGAKDVSEMTQEEIAAWLDNDEYEEEDKRKKKKKKKERSPKQQTSNNEDEEERSEGEDSGKEGVTVKTAAQKKKEKRERQRQQKLLEKHQKNKPGSEKLNQNTQELGETKEVEKEPVKEQTEQEDKPNDEEATEDADQKKKKKKDKKKKKKPDEEGEDKKKKPSKMKGRSLLQRVNGPTHQKGRSLLQRVNGPTHQKGRSLLQRVNGPTHQKGRSLLQRVNGPTHQKGRSLLQRVNGPTHQKGRSLQQRVNGPTHQKGRSLLQRVNGPTHQKGRSLQQHVNGPTHQKGRSLLQRVNGPIHQKVRSLRQHVNGPTHQKGRSLLQRVNGPIHQKAKAILEMQQKMKEEEERLRLEEEEMELLLEEKRRQKEEQERKELEKRERERLKKKEKIERLKAEGKYLTPKQKEERRRAEQMLQALKQQGLQVPEKGQKKKVDYGPKKKKEQKRHKSEVTDTTTGDVALTETPATEVIEAKVEEHRKAPEKEVKEEEEIKDSWEDEDDVKESWDAESESEEHKAQETAISKPENVAEQVDEKSVEGTQEAEESEEDSEEESEEESTDESSDEEVPPEKARDRAISRIQKRKEAADQKRSVAKLRAPVVCVLGHVDTGKTKILDKLRRTHVQDDEAGGITQQIGATNVPAEKIREQTKMCKEFSKLELKIPGLLIIDTPGHESFSNLRVRGSSLCDIAILVIDIMHGLEPQTIESINLLKKRKTPFVVALNKIDRLFQWQSGPHSDIANTLKKQKMNTKQEFDERTTAVIVQLAEQGLNACLFHENKNPREYISMVPTSAHTGDGMGNLIALVCELAQSLLAKRIAFSEELQATVMEVKAIQGLGTTIDVILVNGSLHEGTTVILAGQEGPIVTQIRALLMPQPMKELRVKNAYSKYKVITAAQGCKIIAKDLEKALAGLPLYVAHKPDEVEIYKEDITEALSEVLTSIKLQERGVFVQASTLGSLEALLEFLRTSKIPYAGINIGPVHKKDIMKASIMLEHDSQWAAILAFDVKVEREAQELADSLGVKIFTAEIIYHLFDQFMAHRDQLKKRKQEEYKHVAVFPCKLRVLPQYIFNSRDPIVCGVMIEAGFLKEGMPLCVPSKEFCDLGRVSSLEINHKTVDRAVKGQEVCIKIEPIPGETPKLYGRHFDHTDLLYTKISRQSIDAVKNYFRDEMSKGDWQLIIEMKKVFEII